MGAGVVIMLRKKEDDLAKHFRDSGAISPETAKSLSQLQLDPSDSTLRRMRRSAAIREIHEGEYYLDDETLVAFRKKRQRLAFTLVALIILGLIVLYLMNGARGAPLT